MSIGDRTDDEERARVLALLDRHGRDATCFQSLESPFSYWFEEDACVAYVDTGAAWVAAGAPIAAPEREEALARRFVEAARRAGRRACFFGMERTLAGDATFASLLVGEQPFWDPRAWAHGAAASRRVRAQLRRALARGVAVRAVPFDEVFSGPLRERVDALVARWLGLRSMAPMGFLVFLELFGSGERRRYFVAERDGELVGLLVAVPIPARAGWLLEDLLRERTAPNGTSELLVDGAMRSLASEGATLVSMGLAPLAGDVHGALRVLRAWTSRLYDFRGVQAFKAKLAPDAWAPVHLVFPARTPALLAVHDVLAAFARGSFVRFGVDTVLAGPMVAPVALTAAVAGWTALLAVLVPAHVFPWPWEKVACAGPALAAIVLWASVRRRGGEARRKRGST